MWSPNLPGVWPQEGYPPRKGTSTSASHCCFIASAAMPRTACRLHGVHLMSVIGCRACKQLCHPSKRCCVTQVRLQDVHDSPIPAGWEPLGTTEHCADARAASSVAREPSTVPTSRNGQHCGQHRHRRASPLPARVISTAANLDWTLLSCGSSGSHDRSTEEWAGLVHSCWSVQMRHNLLAAVWI